MRSQPDQQQQREDRYGSIRLSCDSRCVISFRSLKKRVAEFGEASLKKVDVGVCMCGCFGNKCICIYCVLYCLNCFFCIVSFMYEYIYSYLFCIYQCKDYCHRVTTQMQLVVIITIIIIIIIISKKTWKLSTKLYGVIVIFLP